MKKSTQIFIVLNEARLELAEHRGEVIKFATREEADSWAATWFHLWTIIEVNFKDNYIQHKPNNYVL